MVRVLNVGDRLSVRRRLLSSEDLSRVGFVGLAVLIRSVTHGKSGRPAAGSPERHDPALLQAVDEQLPRLRAEVTDVAEYAEARATVAGLLRAIDGLA